MKIFRDNRPSAPTGKGTTPTRPIPLPSKSDDCPYASKPELDFIKESLRIEGIYHDPTPREISEYHRFMALDKVTVHDLEIFVRAYQPNARLRDLRGLDVAIGNRTCRPGGYLIRVALEELLVRANRPQFISVPGEPDSAFEVHVAYETLHPFTDCNGRSGRMLWAWQMRKFPLGFLHTFYYQTLNALSQNNQ